MFTFHLSLPTRHVRVMNWTLILSNLKLFGYRTPFSLDGWNGKVHNRWIIREQSRDSWDLGLFFLNVWFQLGFFSLSFFFVWSPLLNALHCVIIWNSVVVASSGDEHISCTPPCTCVHSRACGSWQDRVGKVSAMSSGMTGNNEPSWAQ